MATWKWRGCCSRLQLGSTALILSVLGHRQSALACALFRTCAPENRRDEMRKWKVRHYSVGHCLLAQFHTGPGTMSLGHVAELRAQSAYFEVRSSRSHLASFRALFRRLVRRMCELVLETWVSNVTMWPSDAFHGGADVEEVLGTVHVPREGPKPRPNAPCLIRSRRVSRM